MRNIVLSYAFLTAVGFLLCLVAKALESDPSRGTNKSGGANG
jgi:hypothetical protein